MRLDAIRNSIALVVSLTALPGAAASEIVDAHVLEINTTIRFKDVRAAGQVKGTLLGLGGQALQVRPAGVADTLSVPVDMLRELQVYRGSERRTARGAWIGTLAGAITGAVLTSWAVIATQGEFIEFEPALIPVGAMVFGGGGALFGAAIGAQYKGERWESVPPPWAVLK